MRPSSGHQRRSRTVHSLPRRTTSTVWPWSMRVLPISKRVGRSQDCSTDVHLPGVGALDRPTRSVPSAREVLQDASATSVSAVPRRAGRPRPGRPARRRRTARWLPPGRVTTPRSAEMTWVLAGPGTATYRPSRDCPSTRGPIRSACQARPSGVVSATLLPPHLTTATRTARGWAVPLLPQRHRLRDVEHRGRRTPRLGDRVVHLGAHLPAPAGAEGDERGAGGREVLGVQAPVVDDEAGGGGGSDLGDGPRGRGVGTGDDGDGGGGGELPEARRCSRRRWRSCGPGRRRRSRRPGASARRHPCGSGRPCAHRRRVTLAP